MGGGDKDVVILPERFEYMYNNWLGRGEAFVLRSSAPTGPHTWPYACSYKTSTFHTPTLHFLSPPGLVHQPSAVVGASYPRAVHYPHKCVNAHTLPPPRIGASAVSCGGGIVSPCGTYTTVRPRPPRPSEGSAGVTWWRATRQRLMRWRGRDTGR